MKQSIIFLLLVCFSIQGIARKISTEKKVFRAIRVESRAPVIDGVLDDPVWQNPEWESGFIQQQPYEGKDPSQETAFKILYDDNNVYVAFRAYDTSPDSIAKRMTRKDEIDGDFVAIQLDSYYDRRTAFTFIVNAAGVKMDGVFSNDGENEDWTWDPIWHVKTNIDEEGWTAEMKIPLSQLRFDKEEDQVWGLQVARLLFRKEELSIWQFIPQDAPGWVHQFGELHGISGIKPKRQIEIAPYTVGNMERFEKEEGNPFATGKSSKLNIGVDGKIGITNNMILDFTVNPDFGQVEADPSQVNLTAYEIFFEEKRPFFIEGKNILSFPLMFGDGDMASENMFYSRRIGRRPQSYPNTQDGEYADIPTNTSILGAAKFTGKTKNGLSIGILESITAKEKAEIDNEGEKHFETVEPLTNYSVSRVQKDFNKGNTILGGMFTTTNRKIENPDLNFLHTSAYSGGLDFTHQWKDRTYSFSLKTYFSQVKGSEEALIRTQSSPARYFQRPDNDYVKFDSSRTSLSGYGGVLSVGKFANGHWRYAGFLSWKSPGLELNDLGFMTSADEILQVFWVGYRIWEPFSIFRNFNINLNQWNVFDFGGNHTVTGGNINLHMQFKNYWFLSTGINPQGNATSNSMLRGGPSFLTPGGISSWLSINSDNRKKLTYGTRFSGFWGYEKNARKQYSLNLSYRPTNALNISLNPSLSLSNRNLQYVTKRSFESDDRYLFAKIDQKTIMFSLRLNYSISPNFTIQYWGQPFISVGKYSEFKKITNPKADQYTSRFHTFTDNEISYDETDNVYNVNEGPDLNYSISNPDFNVKEFKSNLVVRWEYVPGSTIFLVWSQGRSGYDPTGEFNLNRDMRDIYDIHPHNIFLIKLSYRFGL